MTDFNNTNPPAVSFDRVSKRYFKQGRRTLKEMVHNLVTKKESPGKLLLALDEVSFAVQPGETVGIIGPNGAGKSTILKLIAQVTRPTSGEIKIKDRVAPLIELGAGFHPELTGRENIFLNGAILGMEKTEVEDKYQDIVNFAELAEFIDIPVKYYSTGMYLRLAFASAIHVSAKILLIDEILAVGDEQFQRKCYQRMKVLKEQGVTVILVSHSMEVIKDFCQRVILLNRGKIENIGPAEEVVKNYQVLLG